MSDTILAIDLGGTRYRAGLATTADPAAVAPIGEWPAPAMRDDFLTLLSSQLSTHGATRLGIGVPGLARDSVCRWVPNLPYLDGLEVCRVVRRERLPVMILMLTAKDSIQDKVEGLRGGADDYLTKPFALDELLARIVALQRRKSGTDETESLRVGPLTLDPAAHRVTADGREIALTPREFELLRYLMANADRVVSRQRLLNSVWEYSFEPGTKVVDVYVRYLRKKIGDEDGTLIQTVRGIGYMLKRPAGYPGAG